MATKKKTTVVFTKSPTGQFKLAYSAGDKVALDAKQAAELIKAGFAIDEKTANAENEETDKAED